MGFLNSAGVTYLWSKIKESFLGINGKAKDAEKADKATNDGDGNAITSTYINNNRIGKNSSVDNDGICPLLNGTVPSSYLPSYVDDVIECYKDGSTIYSDSAKTNELTPETGKIYIDLTTDENNASYRWGGTAFSRINDIVIDSLTNSEIDTAIAASNS